MGEFDVAQICLNGHLINSSYIEYPHYNKSFCSKCGEKTTICCQNCNKQIRGDRRDDYSLGEYEIPSYCEFCGEEYPWTKKRIEAAKELAFELDVLAEKEKSDLAESIEDIVKDNPRSQVASLRFKKLVNKAGSEVASMFREILIDVISETTKKVLFPN